MNLTLGLLMRSELESRVDFVLCAMRYLSALSASCLGLI